MLVLSRKRGESIEIDAVIAVSVLEVRGNRVRLGITAPDGIAIFRAEISSGPTDQPATAMPVTQSCKAR